MFTSTENSGQAFLETLIGFSLATGLFFGLAVLLSTEWNRLKCSHRVFESTRKLLERKNHSSYLVARSTTKHFAKNVVFLEDEKTITGISKCGRITEKVQLPKLEYMSFE